MVEWQTRSSQKAMSLKARVGSTPTPGTDDMDFKFGICSWTNSLRRLSLPRWPTYNFDFGRQTTTLHIQRVPK